MDRHRAVVVACVLTAAASLCACTVRGSACSDRDRDGNVSVACGGTDCNDSDPRSSASSSSCGDGYVETCRGTAGEPVITRAACASETPRCDGTPPSCVAARVADGGLPPIPPGCGNGMLDPGELCDDANSVEDDGCDRTCDFAQCYGRIQCTEEAPSCADRRADGTTHCRPALDGLPLGTRCERDADCESRACDAVYGRCTARCLTDTDCGGGDGWCGHGCQFGCCRESDCPADFTCALHLNEPPLYFATYCRAEDGANRSRPGEPCVDTIEGTCAQGFCDHYHGSRCTLICETDLDCPAAIPSCIPMPTSAAYARPPGWAAPARICAPAP